MAFAGSDDGASASASATVVCCMCGDHGLPRELFRCNLCRHRSQHRYCSDLYPRAAGPYRSCNWCLREAGGGGAGDSDSPVKALTAAAATKRRLLNGDDPGDDNGENEMDDCRGCSRSAFTPDPEKPIKKPRKPGRERAAQEKPKPPVVTTAAKKRRDAPPQTAAGSGKPARFRVKVRRYKLLAEVISAS